MTETPGLEVEHLTVRFGGVIAVGGVSLNAPVGSCTGLIGPNGAGKTTLFNACFGLIPDMEGEVRLFGRPLTRLGPAARARRGMARTFQRMELFDSLTVAENVQMGREAAWIGTNLVRALYRTRKGRDVVETARDEALEICGITEIRNRVTQSLSTGQRRLVEFARALANPARMLLLDEPSSGLDRNETLEFGRALKHAMSTRELGVLLVEHDMSLVSSVCDRVHVLDFGRKIFEGTMAEAQADATVRAAYLGDPEDDLHGNEGNATQQIGEVSAADV